MTLNISDVTAAWQRLDQVAHDAVAPLRDQESYGRGLQALDTLLRAVGENESHPLADLAEGLMQRVMAYEAQHHPLPPAAPDMELRLLMKERGVTQQAVAEATGIPQGNLSKLANGKRAFTASHARKLGAYFGVNPSVFLGDEGTSSG
ncbi:type II toxin-antitoxin system HigA family antitoxin [Deinococcus lacus]|uniref:Type II toxin-antitoxin system HigA family antitoxin n=1 Tax=Deinococcus lacus TaxID=392561 RepID=A0ABW1YFL3_9DEIO